MELSVQQISYLLEVAEQSSLTAEEIGQLILGHAGELFIVPGIEPKLKRLTVRELFSRDSISRFTDVGPLITRINNTVVIRPGVVEQRDLDRSAYQVSFPPLRKWQFCGEKCQQIITQILQSEGITPSR